MQPMSKGRVLSTSKRLKLRVISVLLAGIFCLQEAGQSATALAQDPSFTAPFSGILKEVSRFEAPADFAVLKETYQGSSGKLVIHIQDPHSNLSGQENLAKALDQIMTRYGVYEVLVEGGQGDGTLSPIREAISKETLGRRAKNLLVRGEISGEEYLNLTSKHPMTITGIEDLDLYAESLWVYRDLAAQRQEAAEFLSRLRQALEKVKNRRYPRSLLDYEKVSGRRLGSEEHLEQRVKALAALAGPKLTGEFPNFQALNTILENPSQAQPVLQGLEIAHVLEELQRLELKVYQRLVESRSARLAASVDRYLDLLEAAFQLELSSAQFRMLLANEPDFSMTRVLDFVRKELSTLGYEEPGLPLWENLENAKKNLWKFYDLVNRRDEAFLQNTQKMKGPVSVLIAGGYHTEHLTERLKQAGYSYLVLAPRVTSETIQKKYERVLFEPLKGFESDSLGQDRSSHGDTIRGTMAASRLSVIETLLDGSPSSGARLSVDRARESSTRLESAIKKASSGDPESLGSRLAGKSKPGRGDRSFKKRLGESLSEIIHDLDDLLKSMNWTEDEVKVTIESVSGHSTNASKMLKEIHQEIMGSGTAMDRERIRAGIENAEFHLSEAVVCQREWLTTSELVKFDALSGELIALSREEDPREMLRVSLNKLYEDVKAVRGIFFSENDLPGSRLSTGSLPPPASKPQPLNGGARLALGATTLAEFPESDEIKEEVALLLVDNLGDAAEDLLFDDTRIMRLAVIYKTLAHHVGDSSKKEKTLLLKSALKILEFSPKHRENYLKTLNYLLNTAKVDFNATSYELKSKFLTIVSGIKGKYQEWTVLMEGDLTKVFGLAPLHTMSTEERQRIATSAYHVVRYGPNNIKKFWNTIKAIQETFGITEEDLRLKETEGGLKLQEKIRLITASYAVALAKEGLDTFKTTIGFIQETFGIRFDRTNNVINRSQKVDVVSAVYAIAFDRKGWEGFVEDLNIRLNNGVGRQTYITSLSLEAKLQLLNSTAVGILKRRIPKEGDEIDELLLATGARLAWLDDVSALAVGLGSPQIKTTSYEEWANNIPGALHQFFENRGDVKELLPEKAVRDFLELPTKRTSGVIEPAGVAFKVESQGHGAILTAEFLGISLNEGQQETLREKIMGSAWGGLHRTSLEKKLTIERTSESPSGIRVEMTLYDLPVQDSGIREIFLRRWGISQAGSRLTGDRLPSNSYQEVIIGQSASRELQRAVKERHSEFLSEFLRRIREATGGNFTKIQYIAPQGRGLGGIRLTNDSKAHARISILTLAIHIDVDDSEGTRADVLAKQIKGVLTNLLGARLADDGNSDEPELGLQTVTPDSGQASALPSVSAKRADVLEDSEAGEWFHAWSWYQGLNDGDKRNLRTQVNRFYAHDRRRPHILASDENMHQLVEIARKLIQTYPEENIVALGRSVLWPMEVARLLDSKPRRFRRVAFSGRFYVALPFLEQKSFVLKSEEEIPSKAAIDSYRIYLSGIGMDPKALVEHWKANGKQTIIFDYVETGESMVSFLSVLLDWAAQEGLEEDLKKAVKIHFLKGRKHQVDEKFFEFDVSYQESDEVSYGLSVSAEGFGDSPGIQYKYHQWSRDGHLTAKPGPNAYLTWFRIMDFLVTYGREDLNEAFSTMNGARLAEKADEDDLALEEVPKELKQAPGVPPSVPAEPALIIESQGSNDRSQSWAWYNELTHEQKTELRGKLDRLYGPQDRKPHILYTDEKMALLVKLAKELIRLYPEDRIMVLGRSALWPMEVAKLLDQRRERFGKIAFSGRWFYPVVDSQDGSLAPDPRLAPTAEAIAGYRKYLIKIKMDPESLIDRWKNQNQRTIVFDYGETGQSMTSFLSVLSDWAQEQGRSEDLKRVLKIHFLKSDRMIEEEKIFGFEASYQKTDNKLIFELSNSAEDHEDSPGIGYPHKLWAKEDPFLISWGVNAYLTRFRIMDYLAMHPQDQASIKEPSSPAGARLSAFQSQDVTRLAEFFGARLAGSDEAGKGLDPLGAMRYSLAVIYVAEDEGLLDRPNRQPGAERPSTQTMYKFKFGKDRIYAVLATLRGVRDKAPRLDITEEVNRVKSSRPGKSGKKIREEIERARAAMDKTLSTTTLLWSHHDYNLNLAGAQKVDGNTESIEPIELPGSIALIKIFSKTAYDKMPELAKEAIRLQARKVQARFRPGQVLHRFRVVDSSGQPVGEDEIIGEDIHRTRKEVFIGPLSWEMLQRLSAQNASRGSHSPKVGALRTAPRVEGEKYALIPDVIADQTAIMASFPEAFDPDVILSYLETHNLASNDALARRQLDWIAAVPDSLEVGDDYDNYSLIIKPILNYEISDFVWMTALYQSTTSSSA